LPKGVQAAQLVHAAGESSPGNLPEGIYAIVLAVPNLAKILALERVLIEKAIPHKAIREPDWPWNGELLAIGIRPMDRKAIRKILSNLPLLK